MERDEGEDETLEVLDEVVEYPQPLGVLALLHIHQRPNLRTLEAAMDTALGRSNNIISGLKNNRKGNVFLTRLYLQFLSAHTIRPTNDGQSLSRSMLKCEEYEVYMGQFLSSSFVTSLSAMMRLTSSMTD